MYNEMIDFGQGVFGIALNLEEDEVGCVILGDYSKLKEGDEATASGKLLSVPVGKGLLGRVVDAIGNRCNSTGIGLDGTSVEAGYLFFNLFDNRAHKKSNRSISAHFRLIAASDRPQKNHKHRHRHGRGRLQSGWYRFPQPP